MNFCSVSLVFFLWKFATAISFPNSLRTTTPSASTTHPPLHVSDMGKGLKTIPPGAPYLKSVNYGFNHITVLPSYVFYLSGYKLLHRIELCQNSISIISQRAFRELLQLKIVDLSGNNISGLETNTFKYNAKLEKLDLSNNRISFHPDKPFLHCTSLETLILSNNKIEQIYSITFNKLPKLRNLMMNYNIIFAIEVHSFFPLRYFQYLSIADTGVDRLSENMFRNNSYPRIIDLTNSPLANKFDPPLKKVKNNGVVNLINIDRYF